MFPMDRIREPVVIEYTSRGQRIRRTFQDPYEARRFWISKEKSGRRPRVVRVHKN